MEAKYRPYEDYNPSDRRSSLGESIITSQFQCRKEYSCFMHDAKRGIYNAHHDFPDTSKV